MYSLRPYQSAACDATWKHLCSQAGNPVIVLPTGGGKSLLIADLVRRAVKDFAGRVMVLAHRAELLQQNAEKIRNLVPDVSVGLYSAGLKRFATDDDVILGGIQSVYKKAEVFGQRHLVLIDEVHLVPHDGEGRYRTFIDDLRTYNPKLRMVGLTATPYRTGEGSICRADGLFQKICYEAKIPEMIAGGYLCPLVNKPADNYVDTANLKIRGGEFVQSDMEQLFDDTAKVKAACAEIVAKTLGRKSVLVFCAGVAHAQHTKEAIEAISGEPCGIVTGNTLPMERQSTLSRFRGGDLRFVCNVDVLTTGFDAPNIDAIAILRATQSPGLFVQICGRGFRTAPEKNDCLILDFGENIQRHGPLDAIDFGKAKKKEFGGGDAPAKECPNCEANCHPSVLLCEECGFRFPPRQLNHDTQADANSELLAKPQRFTVEEVRLQRHTKRKADGSPDTLRVDYLCVGEGNIRESISEWVCLEHEGFAFKKAALWWQVRSHAELPDIDGAIDLWQRGAVAMPHHITAIKDGRFWKIVAQDLDEVPETWSEEVSEVEFEALPLPSGSDEALPF